MSVVMPQQAREVDEVFAYCWARRCLALGYTHIALTSFAGYSIIEEHYYSNPKYLSYTVLKNVQIPGMCGTAFCDSMQYDIHYLLPFEVWVEEATPRQMGTNSILNTKIETYLPGTQLFAFLFI